MASRFSRAFTLCAVVLGLSATTCLSQPNSSNSVSITANVIRGIVVTSSNDLSFGTLVSGSGVHSVASTDPNVGSFAFSGQPGSDVSVNLPGSLILLDGYGHSLTFNPAIPIWNTSNSQLNGSQSFPGVTGGAVAVGTGGQLFIWFGGAINTNGANVGNYSGNYTVDITY